jgi:superfamily II DNA or RNA helicase
MRELANPVMRLLATMNGNPASVRNHALQSGIEHRVLVRDTAFQIPSGVADEAPSITDIYRALASDTARNSMIVEDVRAAVSSGRSPLVLTERRDHLDVLSAQLRDVADVIVRRGGMKASDRHVAGAAIHDDRQTLRIVLATRRYLGEGFDDPRLDALFLALPIAWKGTLAQYVGRLRVVWSPRFRLERSRTTS